MPLAIFIIAIAGLIGLVRGLWTGLTMMPSAVRVIFGRHETVRLAPSGYVIVWSFIVFMTWCMVALVIESLNYRFSN